MKKLTFLTGVAVGYVLGAAAGRERYEQIRGAARSFAGNPKVQETAAKAKDTVAQQAPVVASTVKDKVSSTASTVADKVHGDSDDSSSTAQMGDTADAAYSTGPAGTTAPPLS